MDSATSHDTFSPTKDVNAGEPEAYLENIDVLEGITPIGDTAQELESPTEVLTRLELPIARSTEKLNNLNILMMHVATRESKFEALFSEKEENIRDFPIDLLEFDLLSGILVSEVTELELFIYTVQEDIVHAREKFFTHEHLGVAVKEMEEKLRDSEETLIQSLEQLSDIRAQSDNFLEILLSFSGEENSKEDSKVLEDGDYLKSTAKIRMQTAEEQRHILSMLEKSLAREIDLENKVDQSRLIEEDLKRRLHFSEKELFCIEEDTIVICERLFESENTAEVIMGISKELLRRLQMLQFNLNGSIQREEVLKSKLQDHIEQVKAKETALQRLGSSSAKLNDFLLSQSNTLKANLSETEDKLVISDSEAFTLREKVSFLEKQLKESEFNLRNIDDMGNIIENLKEKLSKTETKCKLLTETNMELNEELGSLRIRENLTADRVDSLENLLRESEIHLHHSVVSAEVAQERQNMLDSTIKDMENLIKSLKLKNSKAEGQVESAEDKCIILSESNAGLNEELSFLRGRMEYMEDSLCQAEESKSATAKDISVRTRLITDLVMQLALERERLQKQISSLRKENRILVKHLLQTKKGPESSGGNIGHEHDSKRSSKDFLFSKQGFATATYSKESEEEAAGPSASSFEEKMSKTVYEGETDSGLADSASKLNTTRNIGAGELNFKYIFITAIVLVMSAFLFQHQKSTV